MIDCKKLTIKLGGTIDFVKELNQKIEHFNELKDSIGNKEKTELLFDIYRTRKQVNDKTQNIKDRIKAEMFLESMLEERIERMSVKRGNYKSSFQIINALQSVANSMPLHVKHALSNCGIRLLEKEVSEDFVILRIEDLGFNNRKVVIEKIFQKASELGFRLCMPEIGPQLILQHGDKLQNNDPIYVAMKPIMSSVESIFTVGKSNDELSLYLAHGSSDYGYHGSCRFIFRLP